MIYNSHKRGSVRDAGEQKEKAPPVSEARSGREMDKAPEGTSRYFGVQRRERIVSKEGKLTVVAD